jgi:hypothetical protein
VTKRDWLWLIGLAVAALATGTAYVFRFHSQQPIFDACVRLQISYPDWLLDPRVLIAPLLCAGVAAAFIFGLRRGTAPTVRRLVPALGAVAAFAAAFALPAAVRWSWLLRESFDYPLMADASSVRRTADPTDNDGNASWIIRFSTSSAPEDVETFYLRRLTQLGWSDASDEYGGFGFFTRSGDEEWWMRPGIEIDVSPQATGDTLVELRMGDPATPLFGTY